MSSDDDDSKTTEARLLQQLDGFYDEEQGGWGRPQKYPLREPIAVSLLRDDDKMHQIHLERVRTSLAGYAKLQDPVAGGIFQYSVRGDWAHPHTEKLGHHQAEILHAFVDGALANIPRMEHEAQQVARYLVEVLQSDTGAFFANQDADIRAGEEIAMLGPEYYALDVEGRRAFGIPPIEMQKYASHNGALIAALMRLWQLDGDDVWRVAAERAMADVERLLRRGEGYCHHVEQAQQRYLLVDQVDMLRAHLAYFLATGDDKSAKRALSLARFILDDFMLPEGGMRAVVDVNMPKMLQQRIPFKTNARLAVTLLQMARLDAFPEADKKRFQQASSSQINLLSTRNRSAPQGRNVGSLILAILEQREVGLHISVVGTSTQATQPLRQNAFHLAGPGALVEHSVAGGRFPDLGRPAAFVCSSSSCSMPAFTAAELAKTLQSLQAD